MKFDILIKTGQGTLYCAYFKRTADENTNVAAADTPIDTAVKTVVRERTISIKDAHWKFGHMD